ncbi:forkhead box protein M1-like isoform X3 [Arapaima gigas]
MENQDDKAKQQVDNGLRDMNWLERFPSQQMATVEKQKKGNTKRKATEPLSDLSMMRPPLTYLELIKLALNSVPDRRLTLQQICNWIQEHFPYYKSHASPRWKSSVRQRLTFQDIFVREEGATREMSYWIMKVPLDPDPDITVSLPQCVGYPAQQNKDVSLQMVMNTAIRRLKPLCPGVPLPSLDCLPDQPSMSVFQNTPNVCPRAVEPLPQEWTAPQEGSFCSTPDATCSEAPMCYTSPHTSVGSTVTTSQAEAAPFYSIPFHSWECAPQSPQQRLRQNPQMLAETSSPLQAALENPCPGSSGMVYSEQNTTASSFMTPKKRTSQGHPTSTPSQDRTQCSPSIDMDRLSPRSIENFLDSSFFRSLESH